MTTIEFHLYHDMTHLGSIYYSDQVGDKSGEYVPLAEHKALDAHAGLLAKEVYELKGLLRRWVWMSRIMSFISSVNLELECTRLEQLLLDCQEALE